MRSIFNWGRQRKKSTPFCVGLWLILAWDKALRRFFVEEINIQDGLCSITGSEAKHITKVLRMRKGDTLILVDGKGSRFQAIIASATPKEVQVAIEKELPAPPLPPVEISLCQALLKSRSMDYLVQKTSELGVASIYPFCSERTIIKPREEGLTNKVRHWREIVKSSTKQSNRTIIPDIHPISSFREILERWRDEDAFKVILWEEEGSEDLKSVLRKKSPGKIFAGLVGPEGGFGKEEVVSARNAGFTSVSLGYRILRAETAAITLVAVVQYEWGDLSLSPRSV